MPRITTDLVDRLRGEMRKLKGRARVVMLFGSIAKGRVTPLSDVDIAVLPAEGIDELLLVADLLNIITKALRVSEDKVDVLLLSRITSMPLLYEAVVKGILLYADDMKDYVDYRDRILSLYLDYRVFQRKLDLVRGYLRAVERRWMVG